MPTVRMNSPMRLFCSAKTCSMRARTLDLVPFARAVLTGIGLPGGFLRWTRETKPFSAMNSSLALER